MFKTRLIEILGLSRGDKVMVRLPDGRLVTINNIGHALKDNKLVSVIEVDE